MSAVDFRQVQFAFAAHLRDPVNNPPLPGLEDRRLAIYRDLFFNNIKGFLGSTFPVLYSLYSETAWQAMARDFLAVHRAKSPYFHEISEEFLHYLTHERSLGPEDPPFMCELAHYEWLELALDVATEEIPVRGYNPEGDLLVGAPLLTPLAVLAAYHWPVHRITADDRPTQPLAAPVFLVVYRDRADQVRFMEVNAVAARLFTLLREQPLLSGRGVALQIAGEINHEQAETVVAGARDILVMLRERDIVLGTRLGAV